MKKLLLVLLVVVAGLAVTSPGMDAFRTFVEEYTEKRIEEKTGDSPLGRALAGAGASMTAAGAPSVTDRHNYGVASIYDVDPDGDDTSEWRFLGIAGQFIALREPGS